MINIEVKITGDITGTSSFEVPSGRLSDVQAWYNDNKQSGQSPAQFLMWILKTKFVEYHTSKQMQSINEAHELQKLDEISAVQGALQGDITEN